MKDIIINLKKDYKFALDDIRKSNYAYDKKGNYILIWNVKKILYKNNYLIITYKDEFKNKNDTIIELIGIDSFNTMNL